ncbi:MAG: glycosyltransferase family 2 protein, partial [Anaerolineae bacterium]|nr:glycosyltransferase family 2 protein [Anaerolineae bacterium]
MTDLSVIVVNWNTCELLAGCLKSLEDDFRNPQDLNIRIIVVDNASTDGSAEMVRARFPWVQLIENVENVGFARANNQAIRITTTPYVLLLNSDTRVHEGAFRTLVAFMETHPETGAAGPYLYNADGSLQPSCHPILTPGREFWRLSFADRLLPLATYPMHRWNSDTPRKVEVIKGACLLLRRDALDQVGVLDEGFFMYSEEMDLCHRLLKAG